MLVDYMPKIRALNEMLSIIELMDNKLNRGDDAIGALYEQFLTAQSNALKVEVPFSVAMGDKSIIRGFRNSLESRMVTSLSQGDRS